MLYDKTKDCQDVNVVRRKLFPKRSSIEQLPPTMDALEEHIKRAIYQGAHIWNNILKCNYELPSPSDYGWTQEGIFLKPHWTKISTTWKQLCKYHNSGYIKPILKCGNVACLNIGSCLV